MPFGYPPEILAALAIALVGAAFVRGYSGFGFSAIFIAIAALMTNPLPLIPVVFACEIAMTAFQVPSIRGNVDWRRIGTMLLGAFLTMPFAIAIIVTVGDNTARLVVSGFIFCLAILLLMGFSFTRQLGLVPHLAVGTLSGTVNSVGVGGLPIAAFLTAQPIRAAQFRASMIVYLTAIDLVALPLMWWNGLVTSDTALACALAFPLLALGVWIGGRHFHAASPENFRRFAILLLIALSGVGLIRGVMA